MCSSAAILERVMRIPYDGVRKMCHARDMAVRACIEQDERHRDVHHGFDNYRVVSSRLEADQWVVTVESSRRL